MDIELLKERLKLLTAQLEEAKDRMDQAMADANAIGGAISEVNYWINKLGTE